MKHETLMSVVMAASISIALGLLAGAMVSMGRSTLFYTNLVTAERWFLWISTGAVVLCTGAWGYLFWITRRPR